MQPCPQEAAVTGIHLAAIVSQLQYNRQDLVGFSPR
jgi:hypothetical protein